MNCHCYNVYFTDLTYVPWMNFGWHRFSETSCNHSTRYRLEPTVGETYVNLMSAPNFAHHTANFITFYDGPAHQESY
jgi:hypothetical protein